MAHIGFRYLKPRLRPFVASFIFFMAAAALFPASGFASDKLTLVEAYKSALNNHESIAIAREALVQSGKSTRKAYAKILPSLSVNGSYRKYSEEKTSGVFIIQPDYNTAVEVKVEQLLFGGGRGISYIRQAKKGERVSTSALELARELVIIETARAFYGALRAAREVEINEASLKRAEQQQKVSRARLNAGTATKTLVLRADAEAAGISAELFSARNDLKNAIWRLSRITGVKAENIVAYTPPEISTPDGGVDGFVVTALSQRRDYHIAEIERDIAKHGVGYARGAYFPTVTLEGVYLSRDQSPQTTFYLDESVYGGVNISMPIFEGGLRLADVGEAKSILREAEFNRLSLARDIEIEVREAYNNVETLSHIIESFSKQLSFAKENYDMVFKQFTYGILDNMDVIDADTTLVEAQLGLMNAKYDHQLGILELKRSTGVLLGEVENSFQSTEAQ